MSPKEREFRKRLAALMRDGEPLSILQSDIEKEELKYPRSVGFKGRMREFGGWTFDDMEITKVVK